VAAKSATRRRRRRSRVAAKSETRSSEEDPAWQQNQRPDRPDFLRGDPAWQQNQRPEEEEEDPAWQQNQRPDRTKKITRGSKISDQIVRRRRSRVAAKLLEGERF
jgi:hypothetical protein